MTNPNARNGDAALTHLRFGSLLAQPRLFLGEFKNYPFKALPARYFRPADGKGYVRY